MARAGGYAGEAGTEREQIAGIKQVVPEELPQRQSEITEEARCLRVMAPSEVIGFLFISRQTGSKTRQLGAALRYLERNELADRLIHHRTTISAAIEIQQAL